MKSANKPRTPSPEDRELAKVALARMEAELEAEGKTLSDYEHNLRVVVRSGVVTFKTAGLAASLIPAYSRLLGEEVKRRLRAERAANSQHVGEVGKRSVFKATLEAVISVETQFGALNIHKFVDETGNVLVWKTGSVSLEQGATYALKGTVKAHTDYKGTKQTELSRCVVMEKSSPTA